MGLSLHLQCPHCEQYEQSHDYTYNVSPMWFEIYPDDEGLVYIDGMSGKESYLKLSYARNALEKDPEKFKAMSPENSFGDYHSFLRFINSLIGFALDYPTYIWKAWR